MKSLYTIFLVVVCSCFAGFSANAQELNVIAGSGGSTTGASHNVVYTIGEAIVITASGASNDVTQGFHQSDIGVVGMVEHPELDVTVYPNPALDDIYVEAQENSTLYIYDVQGKIVDTQNITTLKTSIDVSFLSRGTYTFAFQTNSGLVKRMKIVIL